MWLWDNLVHGTLGPWDPETLGLLDLFPPQPPPHPFCYLLLTPPISSSFVWFGMVWFGLVKGGGILRCPLDIGDWYWRWTFDLYIEVEKLSGGWVVHLDYSVSSGPLLSFDIWDGNWRWTRTRAWQLCFQMLSLAPKLIIRTVSTVQLEVEQSSSPVCVYVIVNNPNCQPQSLNLKSQVLNLKLKLKKD